MSNEHTPVPHPQETPAKSSTWCAVHLDEANGQIHVSAGTTCVALCVMVVALLAIGTIGAILAGKPAPTPVATRTADVAVPVKESERINGLNYLVLKSCPTEAGAIAMREAIASKGVPCTVEPALPAWTTKGWYSVVGTTGFDTPSSPEFKDHLASLHALKLDPKPYKWRRAVETETASAE